MAAEHWDNAVDIAYQALRLQPEERVVYLQQACGHDDKLRREVEALIETAEENQSFISGDAAQVIAAELPKYQKGNSVGRYVLLELLGQGGMGDVWLADDPELQRQIALKLLPLSQDAEAVLRFKKEAHAASRLKHENIVTVYEIGQDGAQHYIAMEFIEGVTLRQALTTTKFTSDQAINLSIQIAQALVVAHQQNVIHRDIKPENIMLRRADDKVKVLDFSIARLGELRIAEFGLRNEDTILIQNLRPQQNPENPHSAIPNPQSENPPLTAHGRVMGTASYMSPEQAKGEKLDHRTDIFSLGLVLLEMVTGNGLFAGKAKKEVLELLQREQEPLPADYKFNGTPKPLTNIIRKSVKRDPVARYETAQAMLTDLQALQHRAATRQFKVKENWLKLAILGALVFCAFTVWFSVHEVWEEKVMREGHTAAVRRAVFSPDGKLIVSVSEDKHVIVWDFASRKQLKALTDHQGWVTSVNFSPDGKLFATASVDQTVIVWETEKLAKRIVLRCDAPVSFIAFSPDGKMLAASTFPHDRVGQAGLTILWNTENWQVVQRLPKGTDYANLLFSPDGRSLMTGRYQFDLSTGQEQPKRRDTSLGNWSEFSPDKKLLVLVGGSGAVEFHALRTPGKITDGKLLGNFHAHQDFGRSVAFSPDGKLVATGSENVALWDVTTRQILGRFEYDSIVWGVTISPDGRWLISTHGDGAILVWDIAARRRASGFNGHGDAVRAVAISPDGKYIASAGDDRAVIVWNVESGLKEMTLTGHNTRITGVVFSPDGKWIASCDQDANLIRWDLQTGHPYWKVKSPYTSVGLSIAPNGRWLVISTGVYDAEDGHKVAQYDFDHIGLGEQSVFSSGGQRMIAVGGNIQTWDTSTWRMIKHQKSGDSVSISIAPDSKNFVTGDAQGNIQLWDSESLNPLEIIGKHNARIKQLTYTPNGKEIISAGDDRKIIVWDVKQQNQPSTIGAYTSPVYSIALSQDGKKLAAGGHDKMVRLYTWHRELWGMRFEN